MTHARNRVKLKTRSEVSALAAAIRAMRKRRGETVQEFGSRLGCHQTTISKYELGRVAPSRSMLLLMYPLAETDAERTPLTKALGGLPSDLKVREQALWTEASKVERELQKRIQELRVDPTRHEAFVKLVMAVLERSELPFWLTTLLREWLRYRDDPKAEAKFEKAVERLSWELEFGRPMDSPVRKAVDL